MEIVTKLCLHIFISGKVQGVWFRASTQSQAEKLGVTGWVRNLPDGRVEVLACGDRAQLTSLVTWLHQGPPDASVSRVETLEIPTQHFHGFEKR